MIARRSKARPPATLGEKLHADERRIRAGREPFSAARAGLALINVALVTFLSVLPLWWIASGGAGGGRLVWGALGGLLLWTLLAWRGRPRRRAAPPAHFLLARDHTGFMADLRLDGRTAVLDGSNLYHFGLNEGIGARAVALIAGQLRHEGFRVVCFFDANIFYTLIENGGFDAGLRHTTKHLGLVFDLAETEIYVVPSGVQADRFILSTLKHMPLAFAVTNDRFRDYAKLYGDVMTDDQWRKGVSVIGGELRLERFRFAAPVRLGAQR